MIQSHSYAIYRDPGQYDIHLRWGNDDIPGFPMGVKVVGEGRVSDGSLCTAYGEGMVQGEVNHPAEFEVSVSLAFNKMSVDRVIVQLH